jgi:hypothetical protein
VFARHRPIRIPAVSILLALACLAALAGCRVKPVDNAMTPVDVAVIGDTPYGPAQFAALPRLIDTINADTTVAEVLHVGDIKAGGAVCSDEYVASVDTAFGSFVDPLMFTPGDNEWADCWKTAGGGYWPQERLEHLRQVFHDPAGLSVAGDRADHMVQEALVQEGFPENQMWMRSNVVLAMVNLSGSNNATERWFGSAATPAQIQAQNDANAARDTANRAWLTQAFQFARDNGATGVVLVTQADMFAGTSAIDAQYTGFTAFVRHLAVETVAYAKPVLLVNGDSHGYATRKPMLSGSTRYGVATAVPNLTQVTVKQSQTLAADGTVSYEWLELHLDPTNASVPFTWTRMTGI